MRPKPLFLFLIAIILLVLIAFFVYVLLASFPETSLKPLLIPATGGLITTFTFAFSLSSLVVNISLQRYGGYSYRLFNKIPICVLTVLFISSLWFSLFSYMNAENFETYQRVLTEKIALIIDTAFFLSIVPYFFWLNEHISSMSLMDIVSDRIRSGFLRRSGGRTVLQDVKMLLQIALRTIREHEHDSFYHFREQVARIQRQFIRQYAGRASGNAERRGLLEAYWISLSSSLENIAEEAIEADTAYLDDFLDIYRSIYDAFYEADQKHGLASPTHSRTLVERELDIFSSFLLYLSSRANQSNVRWLEDFFQETMITQTVLESPNLPYSLLDLFYFIGARKDALNTTIFTKLLDLNLRLYPYLLDISPAIARDAQETAESIISTILQVDPAIAIPTLQSYERHLLGLTEKHRLDAIRLSERIRQVMNRQTAKRRSS